MEFTKNSESLMDFFINDFPTLKIKRTALQQKRLDNILGILYNEIKSGERYVDLLLTLGEIKTEILSDRTSEKYPSCDLLSSHFVTSSARDYVSKHLSGYLVYKVRMVDREVYIYFGLLTGDDHDNMSKFDMYVKRMLTWLRMASRYSHRDCGKTLKVFCFLTPFKKVLPSNQFNVISADNCNSAVTTSCVRDGEILIYREEEFIKVFIHETFHLLGLDFSGLPTATLNKRLRTLFPIKSQYNAFESYSEFWASIMNALFCAYNLLDKEDDEKQFLLYSDFCIQFEQIFSLFQCVKVLDFMGMRYSNLYETDNVSRSVRKYLFKEKTNVFAYYVMKANLLYFCSEFMHWCSKNNTNLLCFRKTMPHLDKFFEFVEGHYKRKRFLDSLEDMQSFLKSAKRRRAYTKCNTLTKTMRMSLCELSA